MTGFLNIYKEKGYTSHDVVAIMRKLAGTKKVGHTGTLDPNAQGVLPVCLGRATKLADYIMAADKTYVAEVILGITTDTYDITGTALTETKMDVSESDFMQATLRFIGEQMQIPPMYSAIKVNGKKLYELARKGEVVARKPRAVTIDNIQILSKEQATAYACFTSDDLYVTQPRFFIKVDCSKGTYIRSLCADIGAALGCGATMGALTRTRSGFFALENARTLDDVRALGSNFAEVLIPVETAFPYPRAPVSESGLRMAMNGNPLPDSMVDFTNNGLHETNNKNIWLYAPGGELIGLFGRIETAPDDVKWRVEVMF